MKWQRRFCGTVGCLSLFAFMVLAPTAPSQQSAEDLFEAALLKKQAQGDLNGAIELFQKIVKAFPEKRDIAAKAQLQVGLCYEKLGRDEAEKAFRRVIDDYPEQSEPVKTAKEKLELLLAKPGGERGGREFRIRKIWEGPDVDITGSVSPDGKYVSFTDQGSGDLAVHELATGESRRLTTNKDGSAWAGSSVYSPDGQQIAFAWTVWETELRVIGIDGANVRTLARNDYIYPACWTPDGRQILAIDSADGKTFRFVLVAVADGTLHPLKTLGPYTPRSRVCYFPDGRHIVYDLPQSEGSNDRDIFWLAPDGAGETRLIEDPSDDYVLDVTSDGTRLLFSSSRAGSPGVWAAHIADGRIQGRPELVKPDIGSIRSLGIAKNGDFFFGNYAQMTQDVSVAGLDPKTQKVAGAPTPLSQPLSVGNSAPDWSPDGKFLAFRSDRAPDTTGPRSPIISIRSLDTAEAREVSPAMKTFFFVKWSPDGRALLLGGTNDKGLFGLHIADAQTGALTATIPNGYWGSWSRDGQSIFYAKNDPATKTRPLVVRDLKSGEDKILVAGFVGLGAAVSTDGSRIAFSKLSGENYGVATLNVLSLGEGQPREIFKLSTPEDFGSLAWSPDGARLFFVKRNFRRNKFEVWQVPLQGGEPEPVGVATTAISPISIHPDGKRLAFASGQNRAEVWVMENFLK